MRWEYWVGLALLVATHWLNKTVPLNEAMLWFGGLVLGAGMLRDFYELSRGREQGGPREVAMCVESIVGVAAVCLGLLLVTLAFGRMVPVWLEIPVPLAPLAGASLIFAGWVHDLVIVRKAGRWEWRRDPNHGTFVVHFFQGRADVCLMGNEEE